MSEKMDERFSAALRTLLVEQVHAPKVRTRWLSGPRRWLSGGVAALALAAGGGGLAYAAGAFTAGGGGQLTTPLAASLTVTSSGTHHVDLGSPPARAAAIAFKLTCLSPGMFSWTGGGGFSCSSADVRNTQRHTVAYSIAVAPGQTGMEIIAPTGARWQLTAGYVALTDIPWSTNTAGQSYGMQNQHGSPDLVAVTATNHRDGYVYANQLQRATNGGGPTPTTPQQAIADSKHGPITIPVYESDGKTQIGVFRTSKTAPCTLTKNHRSCP